MKRCVLLAYILLIMTGCLDKGQDPSVINTMPTAVAISVQFKNGKTIHGQLLRCTKTFLGDPDGTVDFIVVQLADGTELLWDEEDITRMANEQGAIQSTAVWELSESGLQLRADREEITVCERK